MPLTQKETTLLKDMKDSEQLCIDKYTRHSSAAKDAQLKNLFSTLAENERHHLNTLTEIEQTGKAPAQSSSSGSGTMPTFEATYASAESSDEAKSDSYLCTDALSGEKQVSSLYNTCIFEFSDAAIRDTLAGIQKQEQVHGKMLYDYMQANGMYS